MATYSDGTSWIHNGDDINKKLLKMRGWRVKLIAEKRNKGGALRARAGDKGTIQSSEMGKDGTVRVKMDGLYYAINDMPYSNLERIHDKDHEIPSGGWR